MRQDFEERAELYSGSVDFLATNEYMNRPPMPPTYVFLFDVSTPAIESGYLAMATQTVKGLIEEGTLPGGDRTRVCFLAFDKQLYFFNLRSTMKSPQILAIADIHDVFLPQPEDLLVNLNDSYDLVTQMLDSFENYFLPKNGHPKTQESCFISALNTANTISKHIGGRMLMF